MIHVWHVLIGPFLVVMIVILAPKKSLVHLAISPLHTFPIQSVLNFTVFQLLAWTNYLTPCIICWYTSWPYSCRAAFTPGENCSPKPEWLLWSQLTCHSSTLAPCVQVFPDMFRRREISQLPVQCTFAEKGCKWKGQVKTLEVRQLKPTKHKSATDVQHCAYIYSREAAILKVD